jgi:glycerate kinase
MIVIVAPDSFKGNMSAPEVCSAIEEGILRANSKGHEPVQVIKLPLADGGEGTAKALTEAAAGRFLKAVVQGPLGDPVEAEFGLINDGKIAVLDLAAASGIELIPKEKLDPLKADTYGTGELIKAALDTGARELIIGIGGSATNDGGIGMLSALGYRLLDASGKVLGSGAEALSRAARFDASGADPRLRQTSIRVACDVTNPLLGERGAAAVFGPQKGASPEQVSLLDAALANLGQCWIDAGLAADVEHPGDGAAGGAGAALRICLNARIESGAMLVMKYAGFFDKIAGLGIPGGRVPDLVITGEGMTDGQTAGGKLCSVVARESHKAGIPAALLSGGIGGDPQALFAFFDYAVSISCGETSLESMITNSRRDLIFAAENLMRVFALAAPRPSAGSAGGGSQ